MYSQVNTACFLPFVFTDKYWGDAHNRRKFFVGLAKHKGFDPLVAVNWENVQYRETIKQVKRKKKERRNKGRLRRDGDFKI